MTARCCRSCISTATRSPIRPCSAGCATTRSAICSAGYGHEPLFVEGDDPEAMHRLMADALDVALDQHPRRSSSTRATAATSVERPRWPMIVLRSPKGWTGPKEVDGKKVEGFWRAHQVPIANCRENPGASATARSTGCAATSRKSCSTTTGALIARAAGAGARRRSPHGRQSARQWRPAEDAS